MQAGSLRPIGNPPPSARPLKLLGRCHEPSLNWIHLNIASNPPKLVRIPNQAIVALILPKRPSSKLQNTIPLPSSKPLKRVHQLRNLNPRSKQQMNMIRHDNIAVKVIIGVLPIPNRSDHHLRISGCLRYSGPL